MNHYWAIYWKSPRGEDWIHNQVWVGSERQFKTRQEARDHIKKYRKEYEKEEPGIQFTYHFRMMVE